jgi:hypothetical protein
MPTSVSDDIAWVIIILSYGLHSKAFFSEGTTNCVCIQFLIIGRDIGKKEDTVSGVGYREQHVGSVVSGGRKLRTAMESRDCVDGMMIWRLDGGLGKRVMKLGFQTLN